MKGFYEFILRNICHQSISFIQKTNEKMFFFQNEVFLYSKNGRNQEKVVIFEALCFDGAQGQMNGAPNET